MMQQFVDELQLSLLNGRGSTPERTQNKVDAHWSDPQGAAAVAGRCRNRPSENVQTSWSPSQTIISGRITLMQSAPRLHIVYIF